MAAPNANRDSLRDTAHDADKNLAANEPYDEKERWRLAWRYAEMSAAELEALAVDSGSLTEVARRALQSELNRRGLAVELQTPLPPPAKRVESRKLVTVRRFRDVPQALLAKSVLESAGIDCSLDDANIIRTDWLWSNMLGGIKLRVQEEDLAAASNLLDQDSAGLLAANDDLPSPSCPRCEAVDISLEESSKPASHAGPLVVAPAPSSDASWTCHACGHRWQDPDPLP